MAQKTEQNDLTKMNFQELWDYLREKDNEKLRKIRSILKRELEIEDHMLRRRKRLMKFKGVEQLFITEFFNNFFELKFKRNTLFPNNPERFAEDYYNLKFEKSKQAI